MMQCLKSQKLTLNLFQIRACIYSFKKVQEVEFLIFSIDKANPTIKVWNPMTHNKNQNILYTYGYPMFKFLPTIGFKWINTDEFVSIKYTSNSSKWCVLEVDLEYPKELQELSNGYPLALDKTEIKREMLSEYQLKVAN